MDNREMIFTTDKGITVRDFCGLLKGYKELLLGIEGGTVEFNADSPLAMEAYGDFVVAGVCVMSAGEEIDDAIFEIDIAHAPVKKIRNSAAV